MYGTPSVGCRGSIFRKGTSTLWLGCVFFRSFLFDEAFFHKRCSRHTFQTPCERATLFFASVDATDDPDHRLGLETGLHPKVDKSEPRFARLRVRILRIYQRGVSLILCRDTPGWGGDLSGLPSFTTIEFGGLAMLWACSQPPIYLLYTLLVYVMAPNWRS
jgi:hypothetical protein